MYLKVPFISSPKLFRTSPYLDFGACYAQLKPLGFERARLVSGAVNVHVVDFSTLTQNQLFLHVPESLYHFQSETVSNSSVSCFPRPLRPFEAFTKFCHLNTIDMNYSTMWYLVDRWSVWRAIRIRIWIRSCGSWDNHQMQPARTKRTRNVLESIIMILCSCWIIS